MEMTGQRLIAAPVPLVWEALNDPELLQSAIAGCQSFVSKGDNSYAAVVAVKLGPVSARFNADIRLDNVVPPKSYTIHFDGKGGVAGFGKGSADIQLTDQAGATVLDYQAKAQVGGKLAQIGSRLIDAASVKLTEDFFMAFEKQVLLKQGASSNEPDLSHASATKAVAAAAPILSMTSQASASGKFSNAWAYGAAIGVLGWLFLVWCR